MVSRKYAADYRLENVRDKNGRLKTVAVYKGRYYRFSENPETVRREGRLFALLTGLSVLLFVGALFLNSTLTRQMYVLMPFLFSMLPLGYQVVAVYYILTAPDAFTRERNDKMHDRLAKCTLFVSLFSGASLIGSAIACLVGIVTLDVQGIIFFVAATGLLLSALVMFRKKSVFKAVTGA